MLKGILTKPMIVGSGSLLLLAACAGAIIQSLQWLIDIGETNTNTPTLALYASSDESRLYHLKGDAFWEEPVEFLEYDLEGNLVDSFMLGNILYPGYELLSSPESNDAFIVGNNLVSGSLDKVLYVDPDTHSFWQGVTHEEISADQYYPLVGHARLENGDLLLAAYQFNSGINNSNGPFFLTKTTPTGETTLKTFSEFKSFGLSEIPNHPFFLLGGEYSDALQEETNQRFYMALLNDELEIVQHQSVPNLDQIDFVALSANAILVREQMELGDYKVSVINFSGEIIREAPELAEKVEDLFAFFNWHAGDDVIYHISTDETPVTQWEKTNGEPLGGYQRTVNICQYDTLFNLKWCNRTKNYTGNVEVQRAQIINRNELAVTLKRSHSSFDNSVLQLTHTDLNLLASLEVDGQYRAEISHNIYDMNGQLVSKAIEPAFSYSGPISLNSSGSVEIYPEQLNPGIAGNAAVFYLNNRSVLSTGMLERERYHGAPPYAQLSYWSE
ncbi:MAG: hypothetical protein MI976_22380 [Pseudomonadales bacterium]|nr:hypothetical protein [Pseudomonadales bacterium]